MLSKDEQVDIFNIFHDGILTQLYWEGKDVDFVVEIPYLSELIDPKFKLFYGVFKGCKELFLIVENEKLNFLNFLNKNNKLDLDILNAKIEDDYVKVFCWSMKENKICTITFLTDNIEIYDQNKKQVSFERLKDICNEYWN